MNFSNNLHKLRKEKGLSQKKLAELTGVSQTAVYHWEQGMRTPKIEQIIKIADILKVPVEDLLISYSSELAKKGIDSTNVNNTAMANIAAAGLATAKEMRSALESNGYVLPEDKPLLQHYHELNETGQDKAIEQVELLTKIPEYRKAPDE